MNARNGTAPKALQNLNPSTPSAEFIPQAGDDFVITPAIHDITERALTYLNIGYAVHLSGPAGTGKTTLALHIASQLGRRCTLLHGDDELRSSDLLGKDTGFRRQSVRDNYVSSILKTEETVSVMWTSNRLTTACEQGHTLIYDEFTRTPATANNAFLSILEEGILNLPSSSQEKGYIRVHPDFRAIFTSNPEEYVGVHKTQDALLDRMITLEVTHQDRETEAAIVAAKSARTPIEAEIIVDIVRSVRRQVGGNGGPTIRAALAIARIVDQRKCEVQLDDPVFRTTCQDVLFFNARKQSSNKLERSHIDRLVDQVLRASPRSTLDQKNVVLSETTSTAQKIEASITSVESQVMKLANAGNSGNLPDAPFAENGKAHATTPISQSTNHDTDAVDKSSAKEIVAPNVNKSTNSRKLPRPPSFDNPSNIALSAS